MRRTSLSGLGLAALAAGTIVGCNVIVGIFPDGYSGSSSSSSSSGSGGMTTSSSSSSSGTGGTGGTGGSGGTGGTGGMIETRGVGLWAVALGSENATVAGMDVDGAGNVYVTGSFKDTLKLDGTPSSGTGGAGGTGGMGSSTSTAVNCPTLLGPDKPTTMGYLVKLDPMGKCLWATAFGSAAGVGGVTTGTAIAVAPSGAITLAGSYNKAIPAGMTPQLVTPTGVDAFVIRLPANYTPVGGLASWFHHIGDAGDQEVSSLALDGDKVYAAGRYTTSVKSVAPSAGLNLTNGFQFKAGFTVHFDAAGAPVAGVTKSIDSTTGDVAVTCVAFHASSSAVALAGNAFAAINHCNGLNPYGDGSDGFFGRYMGNLGCLNGGWLSAAGDQFAQHTIFNTAGDLYVSGSFTGMINFQNNVTLQSSSQAAFLARVDAAGQGMKAISFGKTDAASPFAAVRMAVASDGDIVFAGSLQGAVDVLGKTHGEVPKMGDNVVVGRVDGALMTPRWLHSYGTDGAEGADAVAIATDGVVIAGHFTGTLDVGGGKTVTGTGNDVFVAKLSP